MNFETKKDWKYVVGIGTVIVGAFVGGIVSLTQSVPTPATITLAWTNAPGAAITVIEGTTNLTDWYIVGITTNTPYFVVPKRKAYEYFRIYHPNVVGHYWDASGDRYRYNPEAYTPPRL